MPATLPIWRSTWTSAEPAAARSRGSAAERGVLAAEQGSADTGPDEDRPGGGQPVPAVHLDAGAEQEPEGPDGEAGHARGPAPRTAAAASSSAAARRRGRPPSVPSADQCRERPRRGRRAGTAARRTSRRRTPGWRPPPSGRPTGTPAAATAPGRPPARRRGRVAATRRTPANDAAPPTSPASTSGVGPAALRPLDDAVRRGEHRAGGEQDADDVQPARPRVPTLSGRKSSTATSARTMTGRLTTNTEPHQKCWSSTPATIGPSGRPTIVEMPSSRDGAGALLGIEQDDDRRHGQRDEHRGADPEQRPGGDEAAGVVANAHHSEPRKKTTSPTTVERFRP